MNNMMLDIGLIIRKEWKEMLNLRSGLRGGLVNIAIMLLLFGVLMPLQSGIAWLQNPLVPLAWSWLPVMLTMNMVADAFAGERERHTLETLLSSRLSGTAIVLGKLAAAVCYGWAIAEAGMLLAVITVNLANQGTVWMFYPLPTFAGCVLLPLLTCALMAGAGTLLSLRSASVRQAMQQLSVGLMVLFVVPVFAAQFMPASWQMQLSNWFNAVELEGLVVGLGLVLLFLDLGLAAAAVKNFQRNKALG